MTADCTRDMPSTAAEIEAAVEGAITRTGTGNPGKEPLHFLSRTEVAEHLGLAGLHSLTGVELPEPDVTVGDRKGWTVATIDEWQANRPGRGRWGPREKTDTGEIAT